MKAGTYNYDRKKADYYLPVIEKILKPHLELFAQIDIANDLLDMKQATDLVVQVSGKQNICVRVRGGISYRDLTIRAWRHLGTKTELHKIKEGFGDWYLYLWLNKWGGNVTDWILVDLSRLRQTNLLENRPIQKNYNDNGETGFICISAKELFKENCIVSFGGLKLCKIAGHGFVINNFEYVQNAYRVVTWRKLQNVAAKLN